MGSLLCSLFFFSFLLPLIAGVAISSAAVRPIGRLAGWLIAFPIINLLGMIFSLFVIGWVAPDLIQSPTTRWLALSAFGVIVLCWLAIHFKSDWQAGELHYGIWLSLGFIVIQWILTPWVRMSMAYLSDLHSDLTREELAFATQYAMPVVALFFALPILNTIFNLWMLRREKGSSIRDNA